MSSVDGPLSQLKTYGANPPETSISTAPVASPQFSSVIVLMDATNPAEMLTTVPEVLTAQPFTSSTVKLYTPADKPVKSSVVAPLSQSNETGLVPPDIVTSIAPAPSPQFSSVTTVDVMARPFVLLFTVYVSLNVHPLDPVIVSV